MLASRRHQPVRCPNQICVHQPSAVPSGGVVLVLAGCVPCCISGGDVMCCDVMWYDVMCLVAMDKADTRYGLDRTVGLNCLQSVGAPEIQEVSPQHCKLVNLTSDIKCPLDNTSHGTQTISSRGREGLFAELESCSKTVL